MLTHLVLLVNQKFCMVLLYRELVEDREKRLLIRFPTDQSVQLNREFVCF